MGKTYEETGLDLSGNHLTYFANTYMQDESSQDGESVHPFDESKSLNIGGKMFTATSLFSSGIGVMDEETIPYRGKNSKADSLSILNICYSVEDDWSIPDEYKFIQRYALEHSELLDVPSIYDPSFDTETEDMSERNAAYIGYDQTAMDRMRQALMDGYAISIAYAADQYSPDQLGSDIDAEFINIADNKWTHFTYDSTEPTHAVTIVGWNDTIKATDFLDHSDKYGDGLPHQPEGDGAWIVKNNWGAETETFPNREDWGIVNEEGKSTGYFYLSYYDRSLALAEIYDFDVTVSDTSGYIIDQYDYLRSSATTGWVDTNETRTANVFTAEYDEILRGLSCETSLKDTSVSYDVYLLKEDAVTPMDGEHVLTVTETYDLPGYHRLDLEAENR